MIQKILIILGLICLDGCAIASFTKGLNYKKILDKKYEYNNVSSGDVRIINKKNGDNVNVRIHENACGGYGLIGPFIFPIIPFWQNIDCKDIVIGVSQGTKIQVIFHDKIYEPSKIVRGGGYFFPLPIKSIADTATLVITEKDIEIFRIPFRYQHSFNFVLFPWGWKVGDLSRNISGNMVWS